MIEKKISAHIAAKTAKPPRTRPFMTGNEFDALSAAEKERIFDGLVAKGPEQLVKESRPLTARERASLHRAKKKMGRPKLGPRGVKVVALSLERGLLERADAYAKRLGLKRSELIARLLAAAIPKTT